MLFPKCLKEVKARSISSLNSFTLSRLSHQTLYLQKRELTEKPWRLCSGQSPKGLWKMSQNGKLMANLDQQSTKLLNLTVLQRIDPFIEEILITAAHVTFYEFNIDLSQWSHKDVEGSLFVVKRSIKLDSFLSYAFHFFIWYWVFWRLYYIWSWWNYYFFNFQEHTASISVCCDEST